MNENEKSSLVSHEHSNLIISLIFSCLGLFLGYSMGILFLQTYIIPTISNLEYLGFMISWCFCGLFCGWHTSKIFWCSCGI